MSQSPKPTIEAAVEVGHDLIGCCLFNPSAKVTAVAVRPEHFPDRLQAAIWAEMIAPDDAGGERPISVIALRLANDLEFQRRGGLGYLGQMADKAPAESMVPALAEALISAWRARRASDLAGALARDIADGVPLEAALRQHRFDIDALHTYSGSNRFQPVNFADIQPRPQAWLIKGALPSAGVGFVVGQSKAGKSFLTLDTTLRLAAGAPTVLYRKARKCGVVYVAAEDGAGCAYRVKAWHKKWHRESPMPFELIDKSVNLLDAGDVADLKAALRASAERFESAGTKLGVIVFDTLSRCIPGADENSSTDMSRAFHALEDIARETGALALAVAHFGKSGSDKGIRGWSGLDANSDATITVERHAEDPDLRVVTLAKVKNGVDGGKLAFRLENVPLGIVDDDGDEIASCVPVFEAANDMPVKQKRTRALNPAAELVLSAIRYATDNERTHPLPASAESAKPWMKAVTREQVRERALTSGLAGESEGSTVRARFYRALEALVAARKIRIDGDLLWLI